ncbi:hypothetical protein BS47DRAFT_128008 [Hydnum rufescens UP504]|uniref:Uncharacterized protein n=1 Tax=Hydnum rufescens UP504 TaxID=1448309 RepID=A0A9P6DP99_9AGAM|nr:hypothetical protein BS47DRAFT_128008 [Hydnum rufescens UP504]
MSNFESSASMAPVPLLPSVSGLRKTTRPISYPSPLILAEERFSLDLVPLCDDDDEETGCEDTVSVTVHLGILSSLHHLLRRVSKRIKSKRAITSHISPPQPSSHCFSSSYSLSPPSTVLTQPPSFRPLQYPRSSPRQQCQHRHTHPGCLFLGRTEPPPTRGEIQPACRSCSWYPWPPGGLWPFPCRRQPGASRSRIVAFWHSFCQVPRRPPNGRRPQSIHCDTPG